MANTLTSLVPDLYASLDVVSRELVGFIPSVTLDAQVARAAVGQTVRSFKTGAANVSNISPAMIPPEPTDQAPGNETITITKARTAEFGWTGEEQLGLNNNGAGYNPIRADQMLQAMRALTNEMETDLGALYTRSSRATGSAGIAPFATNLSDPAQVRKILDDNGAMGADRSLVVNTTAGAALRTLAQLTKANEAGTIALREQGTLLDIHGFKIRESAQVANVTKGTGASYTTNSAGYAVGATSITLITGTGTVLAGDVVTFAGDANKYIVATGVAAPGAIVLADPGLRIAIAAAPTAMTIGASYAAMLAFPRSAIILATRAPAIPQEGDAATDEMMLTDPRSGLTFEVRMYRGYRKIRYEICAAWGVACVKPKHVATLLG